MDLKEEDRETFCDILKYYKDELTKLKIIGENFNFIFQYIQENNLSFNKIEKLVLQVDKEDEEENEFKDEEIFKDSDKIIFLKKSYELINYKNIKSIDFRIFSLASTDIKIIMNLYSNLNKLS